MNIFKMVDDLIDGAIKQIMDQVNVVTSAVTNPLKKIVGDVSGGIWKGDGATRFTNEMSGEVLTMLANLLTIQTGFGNGIKKAQAAMGQAIGQATSMANSLIDVFNGIF